jgi:hypothetical protein
LRAESFRVSRATPLGAAGHNASHVRDGAEGRHPPPGGEPGNDRRARPGAVTDHDPPIKTQGHSVSAGSPRANAGASTVPSLGRTDRPQSKFAAVSNLTASLYRHVLQPLFSLPQRAVQSIVRFRREPHAGAGEPRTLTVVLSGMGGCVRARAACVRWVAQHVSGSAYVLPNGAPACVRTHVGVGHMRAHGRLRVCGGRILSDFPGNAFGGVRRVSFVVIEGEPTEAHGHFRRRSLPVPPPGAGIPPAQAC